MNPPGHQPPARIARLLGAPFTVLACGSMFLFILAAFSADAADPEQAEVIKPSAPALSPSPNDIESSILLTNTVQIVALSNNIPPGRYAARLRGSVIYTSRPSKRLYIQDGEWGSQINLTEWGAYREGSVVEATGLVQGGEGIPKLVNARATIVGESPLPEPKPVSIHRLVAGHDTLRYVTVRGVVRDMFATKSTLVLLLTQDGFPFRINIKIDRAIPLPRDWLDADLEVGGFAFPFFNPAGRVSSVEYYSMATNQVHVVTPGIADRFEGRPLLTIAEAAKLPDNLKPRVRVRGTVTVHRPGKAFYMDDGTGVMHVDTTMSYLRPPPDSEHIEREPQTPLQPGERVEVIGARHNWFAVTPSLMATEFRRLGRAPLIKSIPVTLSELQDGRYPGQLVTLTARLVDDRGWGSSNLRQYRALVLSVDHEMFQAKWESDTAARWNLPTGKYVRVTGVNDAEGGRGRERSTFEILLRGPEDVELAPEPAFWAKKEFQRIASAVGGVVLLAGAWILLQRAQVRRLESRVAERTSDLRSANEQLRREVEQRSAAEVNLRTSEARKAAVLESALDSIITIDCQGHVIDFNPAAEKTFGYGRADVVGREMAELLVPTSLRDAHRAGLKRAVDTGMDTIVGRRIELMALRRDGHQFPIELALSRITTREGPLFTAHIQDISDRKRAEAERERALAHEKELSELKSRFVSMVSHEFRTPLGIIASSAEILEAYLDRLSDEDRRANLRDITDATAHMSRMMEEVLLLGRVEAGKMTCRPAPLDLSVFGERLAEEVRAATGSRCPILFVATPGLPEAQADAGLLRHIFTNLLNNASKYSPPGTPVDFRIEAQQHLAIFTVHDRGIGIPEADARALFQAFHRGRNVGDTPGTGLGMTIVKRCVELHGGRIGFESREGHGSTFIVALPLFESSSQNGSVDTVQLLRRTSGRDMTIIS